MEPRAGGLCRSGTTKSGVHHHQPIRKTRSPSEGICRYVTTKSLPGNRTSCRTCQPPETQIVGRQASRDRLQGRTARLIAVRLAIVDTTICRACRCDDFRFRRSRGRALGATLYMSPTVCSASRLKAPSTPKNLSLRNDKFTAIRSPSKLPVRGTLSLRNDKVPPRGPRLIPDPLAPRSPDRWPSFVDAQKKTFSKAAPPGVPGTKTPSASPATMSAWVEGVCRYVPTNSC